MTIHSLRRDTVALPLHSTRANLARLAGAPDTRAAPVVALHCSGGDGGQWRHLRDALSVACLAPDLSGPEILVEGWTPRTFTMAREAAPVVKMLDALDGPAHLVGHSYGAAVALWIAAAHPDHVASLWLYEPAAFGLLNRAEVAAPGGLWEIQMLAAAIEDAVESGHELYAAQVFADFWGGFGAWYALSRARRDALTAFAPKLPLEFGAAMRGPWTASPPASVPVTVVSGVETQPMMTAIADLLAHDIPHAQRETLPDMGHLGPVTHCDRVAESIAAHVCAAQMPRCAPASS